MTYLEILAGELALSLYTSMTDAEAYTELTIVDKVQAKKFMKADAILDQQDDIEYVALTDVKKDRWLFFIGSIPTGGIDPYNHAVVEIVKDIWGNGSTTISNLNTNRDETVSRLRQLGISNISVTDVTTARAM